MNTKKVAVRTRPPQSIKRTLKTILAYFLGINILHTKGENVYLFKGNPTTVVDIGCGYDADMSSYFLKRGKIVHTFEPSNSLQDNLTQIPGLNLHMVALSNNTGSEVFYEHSEDVGGTLTNGHRDSKKGYSTRRVGTISLKDLPAYLKLEGIDYIKIDIEGMEFEIIKNLSKDDLLPYKQLFIEFHHHAITGKTRADTLRCVDKLRSFGFKAFCLWERDYLFYKLK